MPRRKKTEKQQDSQMEAFEQLIARTMHELARDITVMAKTDSTMTVNSLKLNELLKQMSNREIVESIRDSSSVLYNSLPLIELTKTDEGKKYLDILALIQPEIVVLTSSDMEKKIKEVTEPKEIDCAKIFNIEVNEGNKDIVNITNGLMKNVMSGSIIQDIASNPMEMMSMLSGFTSSVSSGNLAGIANIASGNVGNSSGAAAGLGGLMSGILNSLQGNIGNLDEQDLKKQTSSFINDLKGNKEFAKNPAMSAMFNMMDSLMKSQDGSVSTPNASGSTSTTTSVITDGKTAAVNTTIETPQKSVEANIIADGKTAAANAVVETPQKTIEATLVTDGKGTIQTIQEQSPTEFSKTVSVIKPDTV